MAKKTNKKTTCTIKLAENTMDAQFVNLLQEFKQDVKTVLGKIFNADEMQTIMERLDQVQQIKFDKSGLVANGLGLWDPATNSITISSSLNNPTDKDIAKRLKFTLYHELVHAISEHEPALTTNPTEQENELATQAATTANPATKKYRPGELFDEIKTEYLANELFKQNKKGMRLQTIYDFFKSPHEQLQLSVEHAGTAYQEYGQQGDIYHLFFGDQLLRAHFFTSDEQKFINDFNTMFADTVITYTEFENQEDPLMWLMRLQL